ncbi:hypothetical protein [Lysinibacillus xylanilyticus]|uniref:hypothetical protein n=1 Tax=Lysinibacillus xylanilyticus TaxID=582475 RepID=UPI003D056D2F
MFKNEWLLDVDFKFKYSSLIPVFRRGDTAILKFRFHDNGDLYDISTFDKAKLTIIMPSGATIETTCDSEILNGVSVIKFQFDPTHSMEVGTYSVILTLSNNNSKISVQPIKVRFFDNPPSSNSNLLQLIQDLQVQVANLDNILDSAVSIQEKGKPNGISSLDRNGKIPESQIPNFIKDHINKEVYLEGVHGLRVNEEGIVQYETSIGKWQNVGFNEESSSDYNRLQLSTKIKDGLVTLKYTGDGHAVLQKWIIGDKFIMDFALNGTEFSGLTFYVTNIGVHTIYYKDEIGNEYVHKFNVVMEDLKEPTVNIDVENGVGTIDSQEDNSVIKWEKGIHDVAYFQNNGTIITDNSFVVTKVGTYTLYYKLVNGLEYVKVITVHENQLEKTLPAIGLTSSPQAFTNKDVTVNVTISHAHEISIIKWAKGNQETSYFDNNGTTIIDSFTVSTNDTYTVYAKDSVGNAVVETITISNIDKSPPIATATQTTSGNNILITVNATDTLSGVYCIKSPNNEIVYGSTTTYLTGANGTYNFEIKDNAGNIYILNVVVTQFDNLAPMITLTQSPTKSTNGSITVFVDASDSSGVSIIKWAIGNQPISYFTNGGSIISNSFDVSTNGIYTVFAKDIHGNSDIKTINITNIDKSPKGNLIYDITTGKIHINLTETNGTITNLRYVYGDNSVYEFENSSPGVAFKPTITWFYPHTTAGKISVYIRNSQGYANVLTCEMPGIEPLLTYTSGTSICYVKYRVNLYPTKLAECRVISGGHYTIPQMRSLGEVLNSTQIATLNAGGQVSYIGVMDREKFTVYFKDVNGIESIFAGTKFEYNIKYDFNNHAYL